jgi:phage baseplate assembly protein gpV
MRNATFANLPRIGEQVIVIQSEDGREEVFTVENVVHKDLGAHGRDARPSTQVWVRR